MTSLTLRQVIEAHERGKQRKLPVSLLYYYPSSGEIKFGKE